MLLVQGPHCVKQEEGLCAICVRRGLGWWCKWIPKRKVGRRVSFGNRKMGGWLAHMWPILPTQGWKRGSGGHVTMCGSQGQRTPAFPLVSQDTESFLPPILSPKARQLGVPQGHLVHSGGIQGHRLTCDGALVNLCEILSKGEKGLMFKDFLKFEINFKFYSRVERIGLYKEPPYNLWPKLTANILSLCFIICELSLSVPPCLLISICPLLSTS